MKKMMLYVLGAVLALSASFAHADQISFSGTESYNSAGAVTFTTPNTYYGNALIGGTSTGIFAPFFAYNPAVSNVITNFNNFNVNNTSNFVLFTATAPNGQTLSFTVTNQSVTYDVNGKQPTDFGTGFYTLNGVVISNGSFIMNTQQGDGSVGVTFSDSNITSSVTPEPSSLMLLGTGLVSAAGMLVRRRRQVIA